MKNQPAHVKASFALFFLLSFLAHLMVAQVLSRFGRYAFTRPIKCGLIVTVDLKPVADPAAPSVDILPDVPLSSGSGPPVKIPAEEITPDPLPLAGLQYQPELPPETSGMTEPDLTHVFPDEEYLENAQKVAAPTPAAVPSSEPVEHQRIHIRTSGEFARAKREKLSYQISLFGVPVGNAVLEATNNNGELRITSVVKSNAAISCFYPVDNATETRMFSGRYIMTTIRQREGGSQSDIGFTLCFPEKNIFWADRLKKRSTNQSMPNEDVLDVITGFYFLRNQSLEVGKTLVLTLFDSNTSAPTPVHILRRERVKLPGLREADTLVIWPELRTDGFFRRVGEVLVWLTDDEYKVPVRLETTIALGKVTAELVSAETEQ